ncbi:hypothetical protein AAG906_018255 [Vitis piasezkii]
MDLEQEEMQFLGIFGIYKEAYKIIFSWKKIFSQITVALILPLCFIFLAYIEVSDYLFQKIVIHEFELDGTRVDSAKYNKISDLLSSELIAYWLLKLAYLVFTLIFSLLSTSAVVYTIACIYTGREVTFKKVMSVVPRVWKRLMVTFLSIFVAVFAYNIFAILILILWALCIGPDKIGILILWVMFILYLVGLSYMSIIWQLASVVSVLEDLYGFRAMVKSRALIRGKLVVAIVIFLKLNISLIIIKIAFERLVVYGASLGMANRVEYGILCFLLLFKLFLFGLVLQTIIYFVCKSYHHENIDKSALSDHLEVYMGEYVPLKAKDVQLEQYDV